MGGMQATGPGLGSAGPLHGQSQPAWKDGRRKNAALIRRQRLGPGPTGGGYWTSWDLRSAANGSNPLQLMPIENWQPDVQTPNWVAQQASGTIVVGINNRSGRAVIAFRA